MSPVLRSLFERRASVENPELPLTSEALVAALAGPMSDAGVPVSAQGSLAMPAVWRAVNLLAGTAASLPLKTYRVGTQEELESPLMRQPHPDLTPYEFWELAFCHILLWGNFCAYKVRNRLGRVVQLVPLAPSSVQIGRVDADADLVDGKLFRVTDLHDRTEVFSSYEIFHIPGFGYDGIAGAPPITLARQGIGLALAAESSAGKLFGSGNLMSGVLSVDQKLTKDQAIQIEETWRQKRGSLANPNEIAVLGLGTKFQQLTMPNADAQFLESRKFQVEEIARWFGVPPHMLGDVAGSTSWGTGIEQQSIGFVTYTLRPLLTRVEQRITQTDVTFQNMYAKFKVEGLLRGDSAARAAFYRAMREMGAFSVNEIRDFEDMPGIGPDGDTRIQPMNMQPLGTEPSTDTMQGGDNAGSNDV